MECLPVVQLSMRGTYVEEVAPSEQATSKQAACSGVANGSHCALSWWFAHSVIGFLIVRQRCHFWTDVLKKSSESCALIPMISFPPPSNTLRCAMWSVALQWQRWVWLHVDSRFSAALDPSDCLARRGQLSGRLSFSPLFPFLNFLLVGKILRWQNS